MLKELSYKQSDELDEIMQRYRKAKTAKQRALIKAELEVWICNVDIHLIKK